MPHVNHRRGETRTFVFRREHGHRTHYTFHKGKRGSWKTWKQWINQLHRTQDRQALHADIEDPVADRRSRLRLKWILS